MLRTCEIGFDAVSAISRGRRQYQEDALVSDFPIGGDMGMVVLADGMGGHAAGDVASKIAVTEVFSELKLQSGDVEAFENDAPRILRDVALGANECIRGHTRAHAETRGMGSTLLALTFVNDRMFWISIGDSPLYLYRNGVLRQINQDHSMAPQIDLLVRAGQMTVEEGSAHPDRNCLTSVLCGEEIPRIDCPDEPLELLDHDMIVAASDGLQFLREDVIEMILQVHRHDSSAEIAQALLDALERQDDPEQDNIAISVVRAVSVQRNGRSRAPAADPDLARADTPAPVERDLVTADRPSFLENIFAFGRTNFSGSGSQ
ncbi:MAG: protein phosphatase 2C domain-containing protein [Paracoccaceae bacterium]